MLVRTPAAARAQAPGSGVGRAVIIEIVSLFAKVRWYVHIFFGFDKSISLKLNDTICVFFGIIQNLYGLFPPYVLI